MPSRILLIRHGQASALAGEYDLLSELGREQARHLGAWLARWARDPVNVWVGPLRRHNETYEESWRIAHAEGATWPEVDTSSDLDEHHGIQLVHKIGRDLTSREDEIGQLARAAFSAASEPTKHWLRLFRVVLHAWAHDQLGHAEIEPWLAFRGRVRRLLADASERRGTVLAFTSGGAIGAAVGEVLGLDDARTLDLCWAVRNASITEIQFGKRGASMVAFNGVGHLDRSDLITSV